VRNLFESDSERHGDNSELLLEEQVEHEEFETARG